MLWYTRRTFFCCIFWKLIELFLGDSGGPLVCQRRENCDWYVAGIILFGRGCGRPGFPGVYTNVTRFESWINNVTGFSDSNACMFEDIVA